MKYLLKGASVCTTEVMNKKDVLIDNGVIVSIDSTITDEDAFVVDLVGCTIFPGFTDVHVHFREPGFSYKETIKSGSLAAAHGGYTTVCTMPNLKPVPDSINNLKIQKDIIEKDAVIQVIPYGSITKEEKGSVLSDMQEIANDVIAFSDDGVGVQNDAIMLDAMLKAKSLNKLIVAHCEDMQERNNGYIHDGKYAKEHGHIGINSASEWKQVERDIELVKKTGCGYHVCHVSTKESIELIRKAKEDGLDISCETGPHYLILTENDLKEDGRFKMNPPLRTNEDQTALLEGIKDGTIQMIATDHAPHSAEEKSKGLKDSAMGIVGLETAFPVLYTNLVKSGILSLQKLVYLLTDGPNKRFKIEKCIEVGKKADLTVFNLNEEYEIHSDQFFSKGKATPFEGNKVNGKCLLTISNGKIVYSAINGVNNE